MGRIDHRILFKATRCQHQPSRESRFEFRVDPVDVSKNESLDTLTEWRLSSIAVRSFARIFSRQALREVTPVFLPQPFINPDAVQSSRTPQFAGCHRQNRECHDRVAPAGSAFSAAMITAVPSRGISSSMNPRVEPIAAEKDARLIPAFRNRPLYCLRIADGCYAGSFASQRTRADPTLFALNLLPADLGSGGDRDQLQRHAERPGACFPIEDNALIGIESRTGKLLPRRSNANSNASAAILVC